MLSPYSGSINPSNSTGIAKYINFVKSPYNERLDCSVANRNLIFAGLAKKAEQYSLAILRVPTSGTGKMAGAPLTINKRLGPELGYRYMDIVDYMLLPLIFLFRMAYTLKNFIVPFLVHSLHHNMFVVIGWEDYVIRQSIMMMILLLYHITINILKTVQSVYLTLSFWPRILWHLLGPSSKGQSILNILFNTHAPARSLQKDDLWSIHASRRLSCHHYDHQLSSVIQVRGDSKHQAQPMDQSFVAAINAATSYKPIVDPFRLARLYNHIQSGLALPPDCLLTCMLACISIMMIFTTITLTKSVQYRLSGQNFTKNRSPEQLTGKYTKTNHYQTKHKVRHKR